jgi:hypothetical protein
MPPHPHDGAHCKAVLAIVATQHAEDTTAISRARPDPWTLVSTDNKTSLATLSTEHELGFILTRGPAHNTSNALERNLAEQRITRKYSQNLNRNSCKNLNHFKHCKRSFL